MKLHEAKFIYIYIYIYIICIYIRGPEAFVPMAMLATILPGPNYPHSIISLYRDILPPLLPSVIHRDDENALRNIYTYIRNACNDTTVREKGTIKKFFSRIDR